MRLRSIIFWTLGVLAAVLVAAVAAVWFGGAPAVAWALRHPVSAAMGREIRLSGIAIHWGATTRIVVSDLHVANASWGSGPDMLAAKRAELDIVPQTLLWGPTRLPLLALDGAALLLETSKQGQKNWQIAAAAPAPKKRGQFPFLQELKVSRGELTYRNGTTGATSVLEMTRLDFTAPDEAGPVAVRMDGAFQHLPLRFTAGGGPIAQLRQPQKPYPVKLDGFLGETHLVFDGTVAEPLDVNGLNLRLSMEGRRLDQIAGALGVPFPALPDFRGTSVLSGGDGDWKLQALSLSVGKSDLEGGLEADTRPKVPEVQMNLTSRHLDLADFKGLYGGEPAHASGSQPVVKPKGQVLPDTPIDTGKLPDINIDLSFDGTQVTPVAGAPIERVSLGLHLKNGELTLQPLHFEIAHGDVDIKSHFTPFTKKSAPRLSAEVDVRHLDLRELLQGSASKMLKESAGIVGGFAKIDSTGTSMHELASHMSGDAGFFMQNGQVSHLLEVLAPLDVLKALGVYISGDQPVPIDCAILRFALKDGVATAQTLLVNTRDTVVQGGGSLNFADESLDLTFTPLNKHFTLISLRAPISVHGTFAAPKYDIHAGVALARLGAAVVFPPAAVLTLVDQGLGDNNACSRAYAKQQPKGNPEPKPEAPQ